MNIEHRWAVVAVALAATLITASPASGFVIGPGSRPGLAVDSAGSAYIAWNGPENPSTLQFCRLPRGATACDSRHAIEPPVATTSGSRPFVVVSGTRVVVVQYRYPTSGSSPPGIYAFTSTDGGASFGAGRLVGSVPFEDGVVGPGDTFSGVPVNGEMYFQNVPLDGSSSPAVDRALLSADHQNHAAVGLIDAATPLAVFTSGDAAQERHYDGSGPLNDIANWTAPVDIGVASYPRLAGGPSGLFLLAGDGGTSLFARKWDGSGFGPPVTIGPGSTPSKDLFEDAGGRLHAVFQRDSANPLRIIHAVSDDGVTWRSGTVATQDIATDGGIEDLSVATAPDHVGVTVWHAGLGAGDVRVAAVGPDAPVDVSFDSSPKSLRVSSTGTFKYSFVATPLGSGKIGLKSTKKVTIGSKKRLMKLAAKAFTAAASGDVKVKFKLSRKNLKALESVRKLGFKVTVTLGGETFTTKLKLKG